MRPKLAAVFRFTTGSFFRPVLWESLPGDLIFKLHFNRNGFISDLNFIGFCNITREETTGQIIPFSLFSADMVFFINNEIDHIVFLFSGIGHSCHIIGIGFCQSFGLDDFTVLFFFINQFFGIGIIGKVLIRIAVFDLYGI